ncbi:hypothetical protein BGLA2_700012 [Burkholderia gladioli]|nr:hypothetical protein BGLA2_700012 [Burkholderia gladioli]
MDWTVRKTKDGAYPEPKADALVLARQLSSRSASLARVALMGASVRLGATVVIEQPLSVLTRSSS